MSTCGLNLGEAHKSFIRETPDIISMTSSVYVTADLGDRNRQNSILQLGQDVFEVLQLSESSNETEAAHH